MENRAKLNSIKLTHTAIWLFFVTAILYVLYAGLANQITAYTGIAIGLVILEGLVLLVFRGSCPLTLMARQYSASRKNNFDIFLPEWLAQYNKLIFTGIYVVGLILVSYRLLH
ncbi:hypothetical protein [Spirosoma endophyticum]|uniref:Uncharacterized protein n=1 Tax=Spirosoma endophyticum TaxID=662367 RepID=A0A1I1LXM2_9BACT|nr:hypothetical protein [Spirosoma endophyticum]SFC77202.1 hypothetical protein SAMN05216167_102366 [Spirosoma endophyticum]